MRFPSITATAIAALSAIAYAQDASQISAFNSDVEAYVTGTLLLDPNLSSFLQAVQTDTAVNLAEIEALTSGEGFLTLPPSQVSSIIAALPTDVKPFVTSVLGVYSSIAIKDGVISGTVASATGSAATSGSTGSAAAESTGTSSSSAAKASATGSGGNKLEMGIMAGSLMGVVGLMAAL